MAQQVNESWLKFLIGTIHTTQCSLGQSIFSLHVSVPFLEFQAVPRQVNLKLSIMKYIINNIQQVNYLIDNSDIIKIKI